MTRIFFAATAISALVCSPAFADLKCGDGHRSVPYEFAPGELVTTWAGPVPSKAKVTIATGEPFETAARGLGPDMPKDYPAKYTQNLRQVDIFNQSMSQTVAQFVEVEKRYGFVIDRSDDALPIFENYAKNGNGFVTVLVDHPAVPGSAAAFSSCSVVLQRGVIEYADGKETLYLRSYFHSANGSGDFVNFVPKGGLQISFASPHIWFPLSLTKVISEPASYVVLDVLTAKPMESSRIPASFRSDGEAKKFSFNGKDYSATRITGRFESGKDLKDLELQP